MIKSVGYTSDELRDQAQAIAQRLKYVLDKDATTCLYLDAENLSLKLPHWSLMSADFSADTWQKRKAEGKKQGLVRACKPKPGLKIIDATAGWGRDAAVLASFGAEVLLLERNPVMAVMLEDALLRRSKQDMQRMQMSLIETDALSFLSQLQPEEYPDVVFIDPMHPQRQKSALVKKDLQILQELIGPDQDALELILCARNRVRLRVVVKWPQKIKPLLPADMSIEGKTVRFDVYFGAS